GLTARGQPEPEALAALRRRFDTDQISTLTVARRPRSVREGLGIAAEAALSEEHHRATFDRLQSPWSSPTSLNLLTITAASRVRVRRNDRAISVVLPPSRKPVMTVTGVRAGLGHRLGIL